MNASTIFRFQPINLKKKKLAFVCFAKQGEEVVKWEKIAVEYHFDANYHHA